MKLSQAGIDLIKSFEGCKLTSYLDGGGVWTIGFGHTYDVTKGQTITQEEADTLFRNDVAYFETGVEDLIHVHVTQEQFNALVSLAFNIGLYAFSHSTLLRLLNLGDYAGAQKQFSRWNKDGKKIIAGLTRRRKAESEMFA